MQSLLLSFFDELEKIAAASIMKELSPAAKGFMNRMTGFTHGASIQQGTAARQLRHALTGVKTPELMTEMHGMGGLLSPAEQQAKRQAKQHFEGVLQQQGRVYKGTPGLEQQLSTIGGHPGTITRTPARVVQQGTVAGTPRAMKRAVSSGHAQTSMAPINPYGQTFTAPAGVR